MIDEKDYFFANKLNEECGVFGVYNVSDQASSLAYFGLHALQHRGQEAAGIAASDENEIKCYKGKGLLSEVFQPKILEELPGKHAIGHVRYSKADANQIENVQPIIWGILRLRTMGKSSTQKNLSRNWKIWEAYFKVKATVKCWRIGFKEKMEPL